MWQWAVLPCVAVCVNQQTGLSHKKDKISLTLGLCLAELCCVLCAPVRQVLFSSHHTLHDYPDDNGILSLDAFLQACKVRKQVILTRVSTPNA